MHRRQDDAEDERPFPDEQMVDALLKSHRREEFIEMFDAALDKWLDKKFSEVGKWTLRGITAMALALLTWFYFHSGASK